MKKIFFIAVTILTANLSGYAQDLIYGGFRIAPNTSIFMDNAPENEKAGIGYGIGYYEVLELSNKINLQAEVNYNMISFVNEVTFPGGGSVKETKNYSSIDLPIMVKYRPSANFAIGVGYQFSLGSNLNRKEVTKNGNTTTESNSEDDGVNSSGMFIDMNTKFAKNIVGLRVLSTDKSFFEYDQEQKTLNISLYVGFTIF